DGDAAEYTGRARELLIGFLIALAILVPIYLAFFLIGIEAEHLQALASIPLVAAFYVFGQFAIYRARRYRLTRTVGRGVRLWISGIRLGGVALNSRLEPTALSDLYWKVIGWSMLLTIGFGFVVGLFSVVAVTITKALQVPVDADSLAMSAPIMVGTVIGYLGFALGLSVVTRLYLTRDVWARVLATT